MGIVPTEMELILEQTQQGISHEVSGLCKSLVELEYHLEEVYKATTDQIDWVNPEGQEYPHNLLKPLPLIPNNRGRRVIPIDHFINNDLAYLRGGASSRTYTTSGSSKSLVELEFFLEEVYKVTTDQLDWNNPEGQQYPHNLLKPLPLIPNSQGRRIIPFDYFINYDLEYLRGGASSRKYTTFITKTKAADYGHIKWIEDLFYRFAVNRESARDVYSKHRIIAITELQIVEWHYYKHLDWITARKDDDKLYKFKEGDFKRLRIQDTEDMLLLLTIWRRSDKERAVAMIQAIDKQLNTRRIMRSLEKFVGGRLYEGDFRMLQQTI
nr:hypothetical protein [Tanacetum cinerariifolium]